MNYFVMSKQTVRSKNISTEEEGRDKREIVIRNFTKSVCFCFDI